MFEIEWAQEETWKREKASFSAQPSKLGRASVRRAHLLYWREHCVECAAPSCYKTCRLYVPRQDKACARFMYGIYPNSSFKGMFEFGADIRFRRWGKIEAIVYGKIATVRVQRMMDGINRALTHSRGGNSSLERSVGSKGAAETLWKKNLAKVRNKCFSWFPSIGKNVRCDEFVLECYSPDPGPFRMILEYSAGKLSADHTFVGEIKARHSFDISPGWNFKTLPAQVFGFNFENQVGKLSLYPEKDAERRLIFTWLDLVQYRARRARTAQEKQEIPAPAAKVKCVAWDLDNTLWTGTLVEDGISNLAARPEAVDLVKKLDEKGIIQTVISKNNPDDAWGVLERLGLTEYFLHPAINWDRKSANLAGIAKKLNLNLDSFAVIDDSPFERAEVQAALPSVRVYSDQQVQQLLTYPEFDIPVTDASRNRRASYQTELSRQKEFESFGDDYEAFLRSCEMKLRLFVPRQETHILRCHELIQRANQLNLSGRRYSEAEFRQLLTEPHILSVAFDCKDRFGDYGIVGFASVDHSGIHPALRDFVLSCRVARKRVEHAFLRWLALHESAQGKRVLIADLVRTDRNGPLLQVFDDLHFRPGVENGQHCKMELPLHECPPAEEIVLIEVGEGLEKPELDSKLYQLSTIS